AEDGIRDFHVTGVQTCALPIYLDSSSGLFLNGRQITSERILPGDVLTVGRSRVLLLQARPVATVSGGEQAEVIAPDGARLPVGRSEERRGGTGCKSRAGRGCAR